VGCGGAEDAANFSDAGADTSAILRLEAQKSAAPPPDIQLATKAIIEPPA
jgi:hypothetical protein